MACPSTETAHAWGAGLGESCKLKVTGREIRPALGCDGLLVLRALLQPQKRIRLSVS
jgi:hypothetical protein